MIKAGSIVDHVPSAERWFVLGVNKAKNRVCIAGYPPIIANLSDCVLIEEREGLTEHEQKYRDKQFGTNWDGARGAGQDADMRREKND